MKQENPPDSNRFLRQTVILLLLSAQPGCTVDFTDPGAKQDAAVRDANSLPDVQAKSDADIDKDGAMEPDGTGTPDAAGDGAVADASITDGSTSDAEAPDGSMTDAEVADAAPTDGPILCGNGVLDNGEECDGTDFGGKTCLSETGMADGQLTCLPDCTLDSSECHGCGDGVISPSEDCDDGNSLDDDGCSSTCQVEPFFSCSGNPSHCTCTIYVMEDGTGDGSSWDSPVDGTEAAANAAWQLAGTISCSKVMVWFAAGTYFNQNHTVDLVSNVEIYGAFQGWETDVSQRVLSPQSTQLGTGGSAISPLFDIHGTNILIDGLSFVGGASVPAPGAITVSSVSQVEIRNVAFLGFHAQGNGGAVSVTGGTLQCQDCEFSNNSSTYDGGALFVENNGTADLDGCLFRSNRARSGGAVALSDANALHVTNSQFIQNDANMNGGALFIDQCTQAVVITSSSWVGNRAGLGSAAIMAQGPDLTLAKNLFSGNSWSPGGLGTNAGLIAVRDGSLVMTDSLVADNYATMSFDTLALLGGSNSDYVSLTNVTLTNNTAQKLFHTTSHSEVVNSILWANQFTDPLDMDDCSYSDLPSDASCTNQSACISEDPRFADPSNGDYHLTSSSPCIDAAYGAPASSQDLDGNNRYDDPNIVDTGAGNPPYVDMGAYEYHP